MHRTLNVGGAVVNLYYPDELTLAVARKGVGEYVINVTQKVRPPTDLEVRNAWIFFLREKGWSLGQLAHKYKISRPRVHAILKRM